MLDMGKKTKTNKKKVCQYHTKMCYKKHHKNPLSEKKECKVLCFVFIIFLLSMRRITTFHKVVWFM